MDKEDHINHVSNRIGTVLHTLVATAKAQQQSISGKGKLTNIKLEKIQNFYGKVIEDHSGDIYMLKRRSMAILLHLSSSDKSPKHAHCPPGQSPLFFWQRPLAKNHILGPHRDHETLPPEVGRKLVPVFQQLSDTDLLKRRAQSPMKHNSNESSQPCLDNFSIGNFCGKKDKCNSSYIGSLQVCNGFLFQ